MERPFWAAASASTTPPLGRLASSRLLAAVRVISSAGVALRVAVVCFRDLDMWVASGGRGSL
eukprot:558733-Pyramimonas_sp.AAC.1